MLPKNIDSTGRKTLGKARYVSLDNNSHLNHAALTLKQQRKRSPNCKHGLLFCIQKQYNRKANVLVRM